MTIDRISIFDSCIIKCTDEPLSLNASESERVEEAWLKQKKTNPDLYDGVLYHVSSHHIQNKQLTITCQRTSYKVYVAQKCGNIRNLLTPLSVSSIVTDPHQYVLLGRRSQSVFLYPQYWECVCSGTVDETDLRENTVDIQHAITKELFEETNIPQNAVQACTPFCLIQDVEAGLMDVGVHIEVTEFLNEVTSPSQEYDAFVKLPVDELQLYLKKEEKVVSTTVDLLQTYKQYRMKEGI